MRGNEPTQNCSEKLHGAEVLIEYKVLVKGLALSSESVKKLTVMFRKVTLRVKSSVLQRTRLASHKMFERADEVSLRQTRWTAFGVLR